MKSLDIRTTHPIRSRGTFDCMELVLVCVLIRSFVRVAMVFSSFGNIVCNNSARPFCIFMYDTPFLDLFFSLYLTSGVWVPYLKQYKYPAVYRVR